MQPADAQRWRAERLGSGDPGAFSLGVGSRGALCLHGFSGTPFEVRPLGEALAADGYRVEAPVLAGHDEGLDTFAASGWRDWLGSAHRAFDRLLATTGAPTIALLGFSMGGLLATLLAAERPKEVGALVIMSAPLRLPPFNVGGTRLLSRLPTFLRRGPFARVPKLAGSDLGDPEMKRLNPALVAFPVPAVLSLIELMATARAALPLVTVPTLVVQGRRDHTVAKSAATELLHGLTSTEAEHLWLDHSQHLVALDVERDRLCKEISSFLARRWPPRTGDVPVAL